MGMVIRIILFIALLFLIEFYFTKKALKTFRAVYPGFSEKKLKFIKIITLVFFNFYPLFVILVWAYQAIARPVNFLFPASKTIDYLLIYPFWFFIVLVVQCILLFLTVDIIKLLLYPVYKRYKTKILPYEIRLLFLIILFFTAYVPLRMYYDYNTVKIRATEYHKKDIPDVLNNMRIVLISDIHADRYTDRKRVLKFVRKVNSTNPDLVLIGGDLISSGPAYIDSVAQYLGNINSKYGIYSCVGDHDNWAYRSDNARSRKEITEALAKQNIFMFDDKRQSLLIDTARIGITFATETYSKRISKNNLDSLLDHSVSKNNLNIMLVHQPRSLVINEAVMKKYDLIFAGHTHGGQITFLFPFINLTPTMVETSNIKGDFYIGSTMMVISPGLGMSIAPIRYNSTPEVTVIDIKK
jgi:uncharacterized protein